MRRYLLLATACFYASLGGELPSVVGDDATDTESSSFQLYVPQDLGTVSFGDPLFVPVALFNSDKQEIRRERGPIFARVTVESGVVRYDSHYNLSLGYGDSRIFPPKSVQSSTIVLEPWAPLVSEFLRTTGMGAIRIASGQNTTHARFWHDDRPMRFTISGSSITQSGMEHLFSVREEILRRSGGKADAARKLLPLNSPFAKDVTPLSWLDPHGEHREDWTDPSSQFFTTARSFVRENTALERMLAMSVLLQRFKDATTVARWKTVQQEFMPLLAQCTPWEYLYYVESLAGAHQTSKIEGDEAESLSKSLASEFPLHASLFLGEPSTATMYIVGGGEAR